MTPLQLLLIATGLAAGGGIGWLVAALRLRAGLVRVQAERDAESRRRHDADADLERSRELVSQLSVQLARADERCEQTRELVTEQEAFLARARRELEVSFGSAAATALDQANERFLSLAEERLGAARGVATADLDARRASIEGLLAPVTETLARLERRAGDLERARTESYGRLTEQLGSLTATAAALEERTTSLATALRGSQVRGRWGEIALRNVAELAGMSEHCDFSEQVSVDGGGRPDMVVRLPGARVIAVDAKAPLTAYLSAVEATTESARSQALDSHVGAVRTHVRTLAGREYARALPGDVDLVVLFLPGDPLLAAAFGRDPDLQTEALRAGVLIATPTTLVALLRTVAIYWQQDAVAANAAAIAQTARELHARGVRFGNHLSRVGAGLRSAVDAYNRATGSFERRFVPMAHQLESLHAAERGVTLTAPPQLDALPREPARAD